MLEHFHGCEILYLLFNDCVSVLHMVVVGVPVCEWGEIFFFPRNWKVCAYVPKF